MKVIIKKQRKQWMPVYNLKDEKTGERYEVFCTWDELQTMLSELPDVKQELSTPSFSGAGLKDNISRAGSGWTDLMKRIKKNSGRENKINI